MTNVKKLISVIALSVACAFTFAIGLVNLKTVKAVEEETFIYTQTDGFWMDSKASVYVGDAIDGKDTNGIRFEANVSKTLYDSILEKKGENGSVTFGTIISLIDEQKISALTLNSVESGKVAKIEWVNQDLSFDDGVHTEKIALYNFPESFYNTRITVRSYVTVNDQTYYTESGAQRSFAVVADAALKDGAVEDDSLDKYVGGEVFETGNALEFATDTVSARGIVTANANKEITIELDAIEDDSDVAVAVNGVQLLNSDVSVSKGNVSFKVSALGEYEANKIYPVSVFVAGSGVYRSTLSLYNFGMNKGDFARLFVTGATSYTSSDEKVVVSSKGGIYAADAGVATVNVANGEKDQTVTIKINENVNTDNSYIKITNYDEQFTGALGTRATAYDGEMDGRTDVLVTQNTIKSDANFWTNICGYLSLSKYEKTWENGVLIFDVKAENDSYFGFYVQSYDCYLNPTTGKICGWENGDYCDIDFVKIVDKDFNETTFKENEWNTIVIDYGTAKNPSENMYEDFLPSFDLKADASQYTAYYSNFRYMSQDAYTMLYGEITDASANYTVKHLRRTQTGAYVEYETDTTTTEAQVGETVTATAKTYEGYTVNTALSVTSGKVKKDGSLVLAIYYENDNYTFNKVNLTGTATNVNVSDKAMTDVPAEALRPNTVYYNITTSQSAWVSILYFDHGTLTEGDYLLFNVYVLNKNGNNIFYGYLGDDTVMVFDYYDENGKKIESCAEVGTNCWITIAVKVTEKHAGLIKTRIAFGDWQPGIKMYIGEYAVLSAADFNTIFGSN